jgi:hypothetical protein
MSFTISQTPTSQNLYLYPNGSSSTQQYIVGTSQSYLALDESWESSNDDTDYVYWNGVSSASDWYNMQDHTTETGTINYVRVITNARATSTPSTTGSYKIQVNDGTTSATGTEYITNLTNTYSKFYDTWTTKPSGGVWTWTGTTSIDSMKTGTVLSSPTVYNSNLSTTLTPNAAGTYTNIGNQNPGTGYHWDKVADDVENTFVYNNANSTWQMDTYNSANPSLTGTITSVVVYMRCCHNVGSSWTAYAKTVIRTGGTNYEGTQETLNTAGNWTTYSTTYTSNPSTLIAWTWTDINNLEIGVDLYIATGGGYEARCTKVYAIVNYQINTNAELRTTQEYAIVNYTSSATSVTLTDPNSLNISHGRQIKRYTFPDGEYEIDDYGRSNKTLTISGIETSSAFTNMNTIKTMTHYGAQVTITGLSDTNLNTSYMIKDFSFNQEPGDVSLYRYNIVLEEA